MSARFCILCTLGFGSRNAKEEQQSPGAGRSTAGWEGTAGCAGAGLCHCGSRRRGPHHLQPVHRPPGPRAWGAATLRSSSSHPCSDRSLHSRPSVGITCSGLCPSPIGAGTDLACRAQPRMLEAQLGLRGFPVCSINQLRFGDAVCLSTLQLKAQELPPRGAFLSAAQVLLQDTSLLLSLSYGPACQSCK